MTVDPAMLVGGVCLQNLKTLCQVWQTCKMWGSSLCALKRWVPGTK